VTDPNLPRCADCGTSLDPEVTVSHVCCPALPPVVEDWGAFTRTTTVGPFLQADAERDALVEQALAMIDAPQSSTTADEARRLREAFHAGASWRSRCVVNGRYDRTTWNATEAEAVRRYPDPAG
jgi:hypothetical protein